LAIGAPDIAAVLADGPAAVMELYYEKGGDDDPE
jgi:hypothetical protein